MKYPGGATASNASASAAAAGTEVRYYGIQRGINPGVYTDWATAQAQIRGFKGPRYKKFATLEEAEAFVRLGSQPPPPPPPRRDSAPGLAGLTMETPKNQAGDEYEPGDGPLPQGAEDGFDPNVLLVDGATGKLAYKTKAQKTATKTRPVSGAPGMLRIYTDGSALGNGARGASAGVGVYFGPGDERFVQGVLSFFLFYLLVS